MMCGTALSSSSVSDHHASGFKVPSGIPAEPLPDRLICNHSWLTYTNCSCWCSFLALDSKQRTRSHLPAVNKRRVERLPTSVSSQISKRGIKHVGAFQVQKGDLGFELDDFLFYLFAFLKLGLLHRRLAFLSTPA